MITPGEPPKPKALLIFFPLAAFIWFLGLTIYFRLTKDNSEDNSEEPKTEPPYYSTTAKLNSNCAICLEDFKEGDRCRVLPSCKHMFHDRCVDAWLNKKKRCPTCRTLHSPKEIISFERGMTIADIV
ncbi:E3 ubiquitin-protein ligase ATL23-like protein [Cinnamomum micranthum f. kanehirae]|uniref:E3 ubiquitin-protein ligase ATL23-like protein n=1 Tax=Cinnamomum micranthum f. kanehirae TaxID=337451 RepID=A0A3S4PGX0_9MAGN|nr:E3 ubiquitin-protein ligase ATL23-like protein [Cinnamomum micranthum f. kanehirae]